LGADKDGFGNLCPPQPESRNRNRRKRWWRAGALRSRRFKLVSNTEVNRSLNNVRRSGLKAALLALA
jgi:hypothetical protein